MYYCIVKASAKVVFEVYFVVQANMTMFSCRGGGGESNGKLTELTFYFFLWIFFISFFLIGE